MAGRAELREQSAPASDRLKKGEGPSKVEQEDLPSGLDLTPELLGLVRVEFPVGSKACDDILLEVDGVVRLGRKGVLRRLLQLLGHGRLYLVED